MGISASVSANIGTQASDRSGSRRDRGLDRPFGVQDNRITRSTGAALKERFQCACEGGQMCSREDPSAQKGRNDIPNLHCNWVTDKLLAMARPWQAYLVDPDKGLLTEFKRSRIGMVLNLQQLGEHAHCGPGVLPQSGFSYDPESFMAAGIGVYNGGWRDMATPSLEHAMHLVQIMSHYTEQGMAVAVHCHAGLGRTGLAIASYLVYAGDYTASEAVVLTRTKRPGSLQTRAQESFIHTFERHVQHLRVQFQEPKRRPRWGLGAKLHLRVGSGDQAMSSSLGHTQQGTAPQRSNSGLSNSSPSPNGPSQSNSRNILIQTMGKGRKFAPLPPANLDEVLARQRLLLGGEERRWLFHMPKFLDELRIDLGRRAGTLTGGALSRDFQVYYRTRNEEINGPDARGHVTLLAAKTRINAGQWDIMDELPSGVLFALLEHWLMQLGKPACGDRNGLVNALGVVRTRKPNTPVSQVAEHAAKHMRKEMRLFCHALMECAQYTCFGSQAQEEMMPTVIAWMATALMDGPSLHRESQTDSSSDLNDEPSTSNETDLEMTDVIVEFFTFIATSPDALEGLLPKQKYKHHGQAHTRSTRGLGNGAGQNGVSASGSKVSFHRDIKLERGEGNVAQYAAVAPDNQVSPAERLLRHKEAAHLGRAATAPQAIRREITAPASLGVPDGNDAVPKQTPLLGEVKKRVSIEAKPLPLEEDQLSDSAKKTLEEAEGEPGDSHPPPLELSTSVDGTPRNEPAAPGEEPRTGDAVGLNGSNAASMDGKMRSGEAETNGTVGSSSGEGGDMGDVEGSHPSVASAHGDVRIEEVSGSEAGDDGGSVYSPASNLAQEVSSGSAPDEAKPASSSNS